MAPGVNITWDLLKAAYSKIKTDLDRRISPEAPEFEFDWLDMVVDGALDVLAGAGTNRLSQAANALHQWLVNVPEEFQRASVKAWLQNSATREQTKALMLQLLSSESIDGPRAGLVQSYCQFTTDRVDAADVAVRIVIKFIGDTINGSLSDGERVLLAKAHSTHIAVRDVHDRIIHLERQLSDIAIAAQFWFSLPTFAATQAHPTPGAGMNP